MVKLGHKGGAAIQLDRGPYKREKHQERIYMEKRPWADTMERKPSARHGEASGKTKPTNTQTLDSQPLEM